MNLINLTKNSKIASTIMTADNIFTRMKGLLGKNSLPAGEGLWIKPCNGIHTFGMRFPIDVIFLDRENYVVALRKNLKPNRIVPWIVKASSVIELPSGVIDKTLTFVGDKLDVA